MKNIHRIFEKTAEYEPYEFAKENTVIWQLLSSILKFFLPLLNAEICLNTTF